MTSSETECIPLPPVLPDIKDLLEHYLIDSESLPIHDYKYSRKFWPTYPEPKRLFSPTLNPLTTSLEVERDPATGYITGVKEILNKEHGSTAKNSFSLKRNPGPPEEAVRGSTTNFPFWPGGIPEPTIVKDVINEQSLFNKNEYFIKHPKLSRGIDFREKEKEVPLLITEKFAVEKEVINLSEMLNVDDDAFKFFEIQEKKVSQKKGLQLENITKDEEALISNFQVETTFASSDQDVIKISAGASKEAVMKGTEWAIVVDINSTVDDFHIRIPNPACSYPFELDTFQKQAIIHLEQHESVFVAAHTSAGKTVVAEYCIALCLKHMTRAIYTSPIKALSNQKYRDLKMKFQDVGLLTGDIQINPKASCLIMTTEILQSMLYNGSDTIRDLEWVIFDEVHYINNAERGHVWEEVIIMLPEYVNIVLLSATVPNTVEFADWIGTIKKKKIYVISTSKRPVPLEHYLYTGTGGKTKDEIFMVVDANKNFLIKGYDEAVAAKAEREKKYKKTHGPKQKAMSFWGPKQEMNMWVGLLDHLSKKELLPVVAFTLSKKRCDQNANELKSQDLTTQREKGEIHSFIKKCTDRLQGNDKILPQVISMQELLKRGIGVHHSGILPILKEVVEMLFAKGLVKLLFATETFAMGVNMPARSVVFDSIRKHDGIRFRDLLPSEYIQMAGRAGRRGLDTTGTVIILCKNEVHDMNDLKNMMLGKPTKLESQFKLTYSMILNLLRVEKIRVEDMMKRSFSEALLLKNHPKYLESIRPLEEELNKMPELNCIMCDGIENFYAAAKDYLQIRKELIKMVLNYPNAKKMLQVGRIVKISWKHYLNCVGCIVKTDPRTPNKYGVLVLDLKDRNSSDEENILIKSCLSVIEEGICQLEKTSHQTLLEIHFSDIIGLSNKQLKVDGEKIVKNIEKRNIPRFKDDPPGASVMEVITVLQRINETKGSDISFINLIKDLGIRDLKPVECYDDLEDLRDKIHSFKCLECPQFSEHFTMAYNRLQLMEKIARLKFLTSEENLNLHPEYQSRKKVLRQLKYIDEKSTVTLKGRVACEIGNHELMVTELLLDNIFTPKPIEEITALLSSLVFQQKNCSEPNLTKELQEGVKQFREVATKIGEIQKESGLQEPVGDFVDQFNFGLCEVVYHWSLGMSFNKIMELTDVQEGITVKCIQRLEETLRDVRKAAKIIGDPTLYDKMEKASTSIKRDIVFAASLYTQ
ncbi:Helicase SKI2W [Armadillidium vulgare]|nr:Helicase SKI2W [Armadillidium vulgare]